MNKTRRVSLICLRREKICLKKRRYWFYEHELFSCQVNVSLSLVECETSSATTSTSTSVHTVSTSLRMRPSLLWLVNRLQSLKEASACALRQAATDEAFRCFRSRVVVMWISDTEAGAHVWSVYIDGRSCYVSVCWTMKSLLSSMLFHLNHEMFETSSAAD